MKIEHWHSQSPGKYPAEQLDYSNLLAACLGNDGRRGYAKYCDTAKGELDLSKNPANPQHDVEGCIRYLPNGVVTATDPLFDSELNRVLNLNVAWLVNQRRAVLAGFIDSLRTRGSLRSPEIRRWLAEWNGESMQGDLRPYCQVIIYWLKKKLPRR